MRTHHHLAPVGLLLGLFPAVAATPQYPQSGYDGVGFNVIYGLPAIANGLLLVGLLLSPGRRDRRQGRAAHSSSEST